MQPYLFPYLGYYQLVYSVDNFVLYDDVNFIKRGYINRNNILVNGGAQRFTIPVPGATQNEKINAFEFSGDVRKVLKTIQQSYKKAPYFDEVYHLVEGVLTSKNRSVTHVCKLSIEQVFAYLDIKRMYHISSDLEYNRDATAADKLISISKKLNCTHYVNSPGGVELYQKGYFKERNIDLSFIKMNADEYSQNVDEFVPYLSMIDVLMWNSKEQVKLLLEQYELF
ncbi:WbqC family protein [Pseudoalteromonas luteoviolacea]|nr:WbqC family protein [Pseudoalteromonas luteoviolacea]